MFTGDCQISVRYQLNVIDLSGTCDRCERRIITECVIINIRIKIRRSAVIDCSNLLIVNDEVRRVAESQAARSLGRFAHWRQHGGIVLYEGNGTLVFIDGDGVGRELKGQFVECTVGEVEGIGGIQCAIFKADDSGVGGIWKTNVLAAVVVREGGAGDGGVLDAGYGVGDVASADEGGAVGDDD